MYHAPTAKKIPENQQKEMYDIFKTTMIYFYVKSLLEINILFKIMNYLVGMCFQAELSKGKLGINFH